MLNIFFSNEFMTISPKIKGFALIFSIFLILSSCGLKKKGMDSRKTPSSGTERAKVNIKEGRGISIGSLGKGLGKTSYEFATSNPMWRATLEIIDFIPLSTIDYSGGMIISEWYQDSSSPETAIKISIRFLSNEIAANNLKIIVHEKKCSDNQACSTRVLQRSKIKEELIVSIIKKAALLERETKKK